MADRPAHVPERQERPTTALLEPALTNGIPPVPPTVSDLRPISGIGPAMPGTGAPGMGAPDRGAPGIGTPGIPGIRGGTIPGAGGVTESGGAGGANFGIEEGG